MVNRFDAFAIKVYNSIIINIATVIFYILLHDETSFDETKKLVTKWLMNDD